MDRYQLQVMLDSVRVNLKKANEEYQNMLMNTTNTLEERKDKKNEILDLKNREEELNAQIEEFDKKAATKLNGQKGENADEIKLNAKAQLIKDTMQNRSVSKEVYNALGDNTSSGGSKILPSTMSTEIILEAPQLNPLRGNSTVTNILNLEIPKLSFTLSDDDFVEDTATAKELTATGDVVQFGRNKFKVFSNISETVLRGSNADIVGAVEGALESGLQAKEKKVAFATTPKTGEEHMSFYNKTSTTYDIKAVEGANLYEAITNALADLEDLYLANAKICMSRTDYNKILKDLANGSMALFSAPPETVLGAPVIFCSSATTPIVGDFSYSHFNYDLEMTYERDKNIRTGMEDFVLTAYIDHQIKLKSAFRLATVKAGTTTP